MKLFEFFGVPTYEEDKKDPRDQLDGKKKQNEEQLADELFWFILDDDDLHKKYFLPLARDIKQQQKSKKFNHDASVKKWLPMVNQGCKKFYKKHEMTEDPKDVFTSEFRKALCKRLADQHHKDIEKDEYKLD